MFYILDFKNSLLNQMKIYKPIKELNLITFEKCFKSKNTRKTDSLVYLKLIVQFIDF